MMHIGNNIAGNLSYCVEDRMNYKVKPLTQCFVDMRLVELVGRNTNIVFQNIFQSTNAYWK
jgi:hypothetical protein